MIDSNIYDKMDPCALTEEGVIMRLCFPCICDIALSFLTGVYLLGTGHDYVSSVCETNPSLRRACVPCAAYMEEAVDLNDCLGRMVVVPIRVLCKGPLNCKTADTKRGSVNKSDTP